MFALNNYSGSILVSWFILYGLEYFFPLVRPRRFHFWINIGFTIFLLLLNFLLTSVTLKLSDWIGTNHVGFFNNVASPLWVKIMVSIVFLDLWAGYFAHWVHHKVVWLWHAHSIHHSDDLVDVTTTFRKHPVESLIVVSLNLSGMVMLGIPSWILLIYLTLSTINSLFEHANIVLPAKLDRILQWIIVTPNMHKIHHSIVESDSHSNYGNILSVWDRLFGTFKTTSNNRKIAYGLDYVSKEDNSSLWRLLKLPFRYWRN